MTTTFNWRITAMNVYTQADGHNNVVYNCHWTCSGEFADTTAIVYSTCAVPAPDSTFTPYADLTQDQVLGWIWANGVDKASTEAAVDKQIQEKIAPTVQTLPLPWSA